MNPSEEIIALICSFPCLERKLQGWRPQVFDPDKFYAMTAGWSHGEQLCALFVLNVWNPGEAREKGWTFDLMEFAGTADVASKEARMFWLASPTWP